MAEFLWGRQRVEALDGSAGVDWRASAGKVKKLTDFAAQLRDAPGTSAEMKRWIDETVAGSPAAPAKGDARWHQAATVGDRTPGTQRQEERREGTEGGRTGQRRGRTT